VISILGIISNHNSFRVLLDKLLPYILFEKYIYILANPAVWLSFRVAVTVGLAYTRERKIASNYSEWQQTRVFFEA